MLPRYEFGESVRVTRNVRNDGTYPGVDVGDMLVKRGCVGFVQNVGTFLQDQIIYSVHFLENDKVIGCREEELIREQDPWDPSRFEFRDKVTTNRILTVNGEVIARPGEVAEVLSVVNVVVAKDPVEKDPVVQEQTGNSQIEPLPSEVHYHVRFPGHTLQIVESMLEPATELIS